MFTRYHSRLWIVVAVLAVMTAACGKHGSSLSPDPTPTPTPGAAADAEVTFTWTPPAGTSCANSMQWVNQRADFGTIHWPAGYNQTGLSMSPVNVNPDGSGGSWTVTIKVPTSIQSNGTIEGWAFEIGDRCANDPAGGGVDDNGITAQVSGCSGDPVHLQDMGAGGGALPTAVYLVTPCGVGATAEQAQASAQSGS